MRKILSLGLSVIVIAIMMASCCSEPQKKELNVTKDITPVHRWDEGTYLMLDSLKKIPDAKKLAFIKENLPHLVPSILKNIEDRVGKTSCDSIVFSFGSGDAKGVEDSAGVHHNGVFQNELIARVWTNPVSKFGNPIIVFVRCLNGMVDIKGDEKNIGPASMEIVIRKNQGLCHHLDFETSVWLSEKFGLPLYKGKIMKPKFLITPAQARKLKAKLNRVQVTVLVYAGDRIIMGGDGVEPHYIPAKH